MLNKIFLSCRVIALAFKDFDIIKSIIYYIIANTLQIHHVNIIFNISTKRLYIHRRINCPFLNRLKLIQTMP